MVPPAGAEPFVDVYTGKSFTHNSDLRINQPALAHNFTFEDVSFDDESFKDPAWYGVRAGYLFERYPWLETAIEFFHFKMIADTAESKHLTGTRSGAAVDATARVDSIVQRFEISHGVNYLTLDALVRYPLFPDRERFRRGRVQLCGGVGVGPVIAHAENRIDNVNDTERYELAGAGVQAFLGAGGSCSNTSACLPSTNSRTRASRSASPPATGAWRRARTTSSEESRSRSPDSSRGTSRVFFLSRGETSAPSPGADGRAQSSVLEQGGKARGEPGVMVNNGS